MSVGLSIAGWVLFSFAVLAGLFLDLLGLFGNWVILAAVGAAWVATGFEHFSLGALIVLAVLATVGEVLEFVGADIGAKRFGAGKGSTWTVLAGCVLGGIAGTPLFPIMGTLLGACVGAFIGAVAYEFVVMERRSGGIAWTGFGAALGKIAGMLAKLAIGCVMVGVAAISY